MQVLPSTHDVFDTTMAKNWIIARLLLGKIIAFHDGSYEDNTEEIYDITFLNIFQLLCV